MRGQPPVDTTAFLRINELKNALYCMRISYYALCLDLDRITRLAELGVEAEQETKHRMKRRKHALHSIVDGERYLSVPVWSAELQLVGQVDELIIAEDGVYVVDYKDTVQDYGYWAVQMAAYGHCVRECFEVEVKGSYVYTIPDMTYHEVNITRRTTQKLTDILDQLYEMIQTQRCPPPAKQIGKCRSCQFSRFCNDVV